MYIALGELVFHPFLYWLGTGDGQRVAGSGQRVTGNG